jgi:cell division protein FtsB
MTSPRKPLKLIQRAAWPAAGMLVIAYFLGAAIAGENGVLALGDYRRAKAEQSVRLAELQTERAQLAHRSSLLDPRHADPDLVEELTRRELGLVRPDEIIIENRPATREAAAPAP